LTAAFTIGYAVTAQTTPAKSQPVLDITSMDTSVDPCADFFATPAAVGSRKTRSLPIKVHGAFISSWKPTKRQFCARFWKVLLHLRPIAML
jgi:hypothetical protein